MQRTLHRGQGQVDAVPILWYVDRWLRNVVALVNVQNLLARLEQRSGLRLMLRVCRRHELGYVEHLLAVASLAYDVGAVRDNGRLQRHHVLGVGHNGAGLVFGAANRNFRRVGPVGRIVGA